MFRGVARGPGLITISDLTQTSSIQGIGIGIFNDNIEERKGKFNDSLPAGLIKYSDKIPKIHRLFQDNGQRTLFVGWDVGQRSRGMGC